jgi:hypothetical protein
MQRRHYLIVLASASTPLLAGCSGDGEESTDGGDSGGDGTNGNESTSEDGTDGSATEDGDGGDQTDQATDGSDQDSTDQSTSGPAAVVERWYELQNQAVEQEDPQLFLENAKDFLHSKSPLLDLFEEAGSDDGEDEAEAFRNFQTEITDRNLGAEELDTQFLLTSDALNVEQSVLEEIAQKNAVVVATNDQDEEATWLLVPENGEWKVFSGFQIESN